MTNNNLGVAETTNATTKHTMKAKLLLSVLALGASAWMLNAQDQDAPRRPGPRDGEPRGEFRGPPDGERPPGDPRDGERAPGGPGGQRMRPPIIAALDANGDGVIDEAELKNATAALKALDKNGDGKLTMDELMPPRPQGFAGRGGPEGGPGVGGPEGRRPRVDGQGGPNGERPPRPPQEQ